MSQNYSHQRLPELLSAYYRYLFPHRLFHRWLAYGNVENGYFSRREFSFCLSGEVYLRYQSFADCAEMEKSILAKLPEKIDIGAVYNTKPIESRSAGILTFTAEERELVFDIDMTDYDDVRNCCNGANICHKCWPFMTIAAKILDRALRCDFGFKHLLWVYSGRRGIHCWVADQRARKLDVKARYAIAEYLNLIQGGQFKSKKVAFDGRRNLHPSIVSAIHIIDNYFESVVLEKQKILETREQMKAVIDMCSDPALQENLKLKFFSNDNSFNSNYKNSTDRWREIVKSSEEHFPARPYNKQSGRHFIAELKLQFCYPRLDINVTKGLNHLLKTPFSVHPKTGRVCVPIDFNSIDNFDPFKVPDIVSLCTQIDENSDQTDKIVRIYEKTDLADSIEIFKLFVKNIECDFRGALIKKSDEKMEF